MQCALGDLSQTQRQRSFGRRGMSLPKNCPEMPLVWRFPLEPFFEINPGFLCSEIDND